MKSYLKSENAGAQMWQMLASNLTSGDHPYNFAGFCMALVVEWLLKVKFSGGQTPEELGRYLLTANLGSLGYRLLARSQGRYENNENDQAMIKRHSVGALKSGNSETRNSSQAHWKLIRSKVYDVTDEEFPTIRLNDRVVPYAGLIGLSGNHKGLLRRILGEGWSHAIGVYSDRNTIYIFDPNYGVFVFERDNQLRLSMFINIMWIEYDATEGELVDISSS